jgi:catechol 2,3-dioxygenase-like lactoylglutathione lyase family enzyme
MKGRAMSEIGRLEHVGIGASRDRFDETIRFYEQVFGWHRIKEQPGDLAFIGDGEGGRLEILARDAAPLSMPHHLAFVVDPAHFEATLAALRASGVPVQEPSKNAFGDTMVFFSDPAGNAAQIVSRLEPMAP